MESDSMYLVEGACDNEGDGRNSPKTRLSTVQVRQPFVLSQKWGGIPHSAAAVAIVLCKVWEN